MLTEFDKKAFLTNFEIACEAGILALVADLIWLLHDIVNSGLSVWYSFVGLGLIGGIVLTGFALWRHHKYYTHRLMVRPKRIYKPRKNKIQVQEAI